MWPRVMSLAPTSGSIWNYLLIIMDTAPSNFEQPSEVPTSSVPFIFSSGSVFVALIFTVSDTNWSLESQRHAVGRSIDTRPEPYRIREAHRPEPSPRPHGQSSRHPSRCVACPPAPSVQ